MTRSGRPGRTGPFRTLGAVLGAAAALGLVSAAACLADLPPYDADGGTGGQDGGGAAPKDATAAPFCGDGIIQRAAGEVCDPGPDAGTISSCSADCTVIICPGGLVGPANDHCYFVPDGGNVAMSRAAAECAALGAHVVTFDDVDEQDEVDGFFGADGGTYWIALTQDATQADPIYDVGSVNEPGWRASCSGCYGPTLKAGQTSFLNFCKAFFVAAPCVAHTPTNPAFIGVSCSGSCEADASAVEDADTGVLGVHALCEREPAGLTGVPCDDGGVCITLKDRSSSYELVMSPATWAAAQTACTQKTSSSGAHGHLVVFNMRDERAQLSRELSARLQPGAPELNYWVGLQYVASDAGGAWTWVGGHPETVYPSEWADGEPSPSTGPLAFATVEVVAESTTFDRQLLHAGFDQDSPLPYVCEFETP